MAKYDILVVFVASGTGVFNCDARRLVGMYQHIPPELSDPTIVYFKPIQDHYGLNKFGKSPVRYLDFLEEGNPMICLTAKDLQGRSGLITPVDNELPSRVGSTQQRGLHSMKSDLDICGNIMDLICFHKNEVSLLKFTNWISPITNSSLIIPSDGASE